MWYGRQTEDKGGLMAFGIAAIGIIFLAIGIVYVSKIVDKERGE